MGFLLNALMMANSKSDSKYVLPGFPMPHESDTNFLYFGEKVMFSRS
jgi:hypothetical protein